VKAACHRRPRVPPDPRVVALLAKSLMHGLLQAGMANCGKHFRAMASSRPIRTPTSRVDRRSLKAILADDARPMAGSAPRWPA
jgi:beta-N-acetylhexosaminidase